MIKNPDKPLKVDKKECPIGIGSRIAVYRIGENIRGKVARIPLIINDETVSREIFSFQLLKPYFTEFLPHLDIAQILFHEKVFEALICDMINSPETKARFNVFHLSSHLDSLVDI